MCRCRWDAVYAWPLASVAGFGGRKQVNRFSVLPDKRLLNLCASLHADGRDNGQADHYACNKTQFCPGKYAGRDHLMQHMDAVAGGRRPGTA